MSTIAKKRSIFSVLFSSQIDVDIQKNNLENLSAKEIEQVSPEQMAELRAFEIRQITKEQNVEQGFNILGGFINSLAFRKMRGIHKEVVQENETKQKRKTNTKTQKRDDIEIGDN